MRTGKVLLGVLAGVAAGALMGILFAPEKGSKTRKKIMRKGQDYADELKEKFEEVVDQVTEKYEQTRQSAEDMVSKAKFRPADSRKETHKNATEA